jgi:glycosyltransferase involved in cell wall biosynthesis
VNPPIVSRPFKEEAEGASRLTQISVVVPTHQRPSLLAKALMSITRQSFQPLEVIVVDDSADSATRHLVLELAATSATPMRYVVNADPGVCRSRNLGASLCASSMIAFIDDDDEWLDHFLERCSAALSDSGADFVLADIERVFPGGSVKRLTTRPSLTAETALNHRVHMTGSSFIIRRDAFRSVGGFDPDVPVFNDWDLFLRLVKSGKTYHVVQEPLVRWIEHSGARITTPTLRRADGIDRFLSIYGPEMRFDVRAYFLRLAYGIRKENERSRWHRLALTWRMMARAGLCGSAYIAWQNVDQRLARQGSSSATRQD